MKNYLEYLIGEHVYSGDYKKMTSYSIVGVLMSEKMVLPVFYSKIDLKPVLES